MLDRGLPGRAGRPPVRSSIQFGARQFGAHREWKRRVIQQDSRVADGISPNVSAKPLKAKKTANGDHKPPFRPAVTGQPRDRGRARMQTWLRPCADRHQPLPSILSQDPLTRPFGHRFACSGLVPEIAVADRSGAGWSNGASGPDNSVTAIEVITVTGPGRRRPLGHDQGWLSARLTEALSSSASCTNGDVVAVFNARLAPAL